MVNHVRIKICGVTTPADARQAALLGADAIGLNFYLGSPRHVNLATAQCILAELPLFLEAVGIFVNQSLDEVIDQTLQPLGMRLQVIQMHGDQPVRPARYPWRWIPAFAVRDRDSLLTIRRYLDECRAQEALPTAILVDAHVPGAHGGTGQTAPWEVLADFRPGVPLILAGGLTPENVATAVRLVRPYAVDVASGVEDRPGHKDTEKMRRFIGNAREAAARQLAGD